MRKPFLIVAAVVVILLSLVGLKNIQKTKKPKMNHKQKMEQIVQKSGLSIDRGIAKYEINDYAGAIDDFDKILEIEKDNARAYTYRGQAEMRMGDFDAAIADFDKAIKINPNDKLAEFEKKQALEIKSKVPSRPIRREKTQNHKKPADKKVKNKK